VGKVEIATFGKDQYHWHPGDTRFVAHAEHSGSFQLWQIRKAEPTRTARSYIHQMAGKDASYDLPAASIVVIRGKVGAPNGW
jgi:hypothetical protein